jgi:hypothetical protein
MNDKEAMNVASQCRATASADLCKNILVDGGSGFLFELLLDAAKAIETLAQEKALQVLHNENERLGLYRDAYAEQDPVTWLCTPDEDGLFGLPLSDKGCKDCFPVYRHPPQRTEQEPVAIDGNTSDGYHTFNELYEFRKAYNAALFNEWATGGKCSVHKSWRHHDGELCFGGGWFIVVAVLPNGQISNHYEAKDWDLFDVPETERALFEFDGHTRIDVVARLKAYTIPPQRTWVGLTEQEHIDIAVECGCMSADWVFYGAAVERKVKERNQ